VGLKIEPVTGDVSYTTGRGAGGTGTWRPTSYRAPVGEWQRFSIQVDFAKAAYSAHAGDNLGTVLAQDVPRSGAHRAGGTDVVALHQAERLAADDARRSRRGRRARSGDRRVV